MATERLKSESILHKIREKDEFQRGYVLEHPDVARTIEDTEQEEEQWHVRQGNSSRLTTSWDPASLRQRLQRC